MGVVPNPNTETVEQAAIDQRATDPRLEQNTTSEVEVQSQAPEESVEAPETQEETPQPKPKKSAEEVLKGRIGHVTKQLSAKDQELAETRRQLEAAQALLTAKQAVPGEEQTPVAPVQPSGPKTYTQEDFEAAVAARAEVEAFNQRADEMYNTGAEKFDDWKDTVDTLVASGFMNKDLLDAAMAVEDGPAVLHHLGTNLDEAERISALPPIRKAAEMAKLSAKLAAPKTVPVSGAPTPIKPLNGSPNPTVDLQRVADEGDMSAYVAARAKQGSRWAQARG